MRRLFSTLLLLLLAVPAYAADEPNPNTLTPKEAADGWLLLFDGETTFGWNAVNDAKWTALKGMLAPQANVAGPLVSTTEFSEFELQMQYQVKEGSRAKVVLGCDEKGDSPGIASEVHLFPRGGWWELTVTAKGDRIKTSRRSMGLLAGEAFEQETKNTVGRGRIALVGEGMVVRKMKLKPLNTTPLFNGKDLTGWKKYEGDKARAKSEFTVTPEGWINLKNGPGDLQTEGHWADFVLQLECISNGSHLNSGVFFRCIPGQYQNGYEAQIRNEFKDEPTEYTVEEYDPKTNELKEKKKVKSPAVDYGTGAIYRRQPARTQASKDGEWFTMTVIAHGRHIATWVNGVQQVDWTDNRPLKDNPREGCRLEKGAISLQGHDPTTDLSFRNFRIAELPAGK
jgi:Domain of Unknown Function (DUF1080)